ncbi:uncharacterized protein LOC135839985 [Planococcus citri]|uniref:uncharacterized protein LOC135839985 n=1 Tax=Planococcus citri TaxID=170843 RepID=UPI0031F8A876
MTTIEEDIVPIAILGFLVFGENTDELVDQLKELGVLRLTDNKELTNKSENNSSNELKKSASSSKQHLTRTMSINIHGTVEVERQFVNGIEKFKVITKTDEPFKLDALEQEVFVLKEKDVKLNFQMKNVHLYDVNNFIIQGTKSLSKDDWAQITFDLPRTVKLTCRYFINGMVLGKTVRDSGTAEIQLIGVNVSGKVKVSVTTKEINILELDLSYSFENLVVEKISLLFAGMTKDEISKLFSDTTKKYLKENMDLISGRLSREIKSKLNTRLKNISSAKIVHQVKHKHVKEDDNSIPKL